MKRYIISIGSIVLISLLILSGHAFFFERNKVESIKKTNSSPKVKSNKISAQELTITNKVEQKSNKDLNQKEILKVNSKPQEDSTLFTPDKNKKMNNQKNKVIQPKVKLSLVDRIQEHTVQYGENLFSIAKKYDINIDTILGANDITNMNKIKPGMKIKILPVKGILYKINPGESLWEIARRFDINLNKITESNNIDNPDQVQLGKLIVLPGAKPEFGYEDRLKKKFIPPINTRISSYFGYRAHPISGKRKLHEGIDYAVNIGTTVRAARGGKIVYSGWARGYGKTIIIEHQKGLRTLYAHNSRLLVHSGERVYRGQPISKSGNTGRSTGPHLHFEIQINSRPVNPLNYLK